MFELLSATADNLFAFLRSVLFAFFASLYCPVRWFPQKRKLTIITFAVTRLLLQILILDHWNPYETADIGILGKQLVYLGVAILWVVFFFRTERYMVFLIPVLIISISDICMFLSNEFLQFSSMLISRFDPLLAEEIRDNAPLPNMAKVEETKMQVKDKIDEVLDKLKLLSEDVKGIKVDDIV